MLRDGAEVLVISSGILTMRALEAAADLAKDNVGVARGAVAGSQCGCIVATTNHNPRPTVTVWANRSQSLRMGGAIIGCGLRARPDRQWPPWRACRCC